MKWVHKGRNFCVAMQFSTAAVMMVLAQTAGEPGVSFLPWASLSSLSGHEIPLLVMMSQQRPCSPPDEFQVTTKNLKLRLYYRVLVLPFLTLVVQVALCSSLLGIVRYPQPGDSLKILLSPSSMTVLGMRIGNDYQPGPIF